MTQKQIKFLNTPLVETENILINIWSVTHLNWGILFGLLSLKYERWFNIVSLLIFHTLFEIWELWAFGYLGPQAQGSLKAPVFTFAEGLDILFDTVFSVLGFYWARKCPYSALAFFILFNIVLFIR